MRVLWCVVMLVLGVAHSQTREPGQGVNFYSKEKEIALGRQLAQQFRQKTTLVDSVSVNDYVQRVGANLAAQFPGGWTYRIETIREDQGGATHEPVAFPAGFIFVPADLIAASRNEAEFAGMMAHAMAHVVASHGTKSATRSHIMSVPDTPDNWTGASVPMGLLAFQRANEREADYLAVKAMAAAGYDPAGLASYVKRVQPPHGNGNASAVFATLPPRDERVAAIQAEIRQLAAGAYHESDEFFRVQAEVSVPVVARPAPSLFKK